MKLGLIGKPLGHSKSPWIHKELAGAEYSLWELAPQELDAFFEKRDFSGINVTIPYKQAVIRYLDRLEGDAAQIRAVNTVVNRGGELVGYNTDVAGARYMLRSLGVRTEGAKAAVLGSGGAARAVAQALMQLGAEPFLVSRWPQKALEFGSVRIISYEELYAKPEGISLLVNATPAGMSPDIDGIAADISRLPELEAAADAVANPLRTRLVFEAGQRGLKTAGGLGMLVAQAYASEKLFGGSVKDPSSVESCIKRLASASKNIVLTGMPSAGKTTAGRILAKKAGLPFTDMDEELEKRFGMTIAEYFERYGEASFRACEKQLAEELSHLEGHVIATGGGTVTDPDNMRRLMAGGEVVWLDRSMKLLTASRERPLAADSASLQRLWTERRSLYKKYSDIVIDADGSPEETVQELMKLLPEER